MFSSRAVDVARNVSGFSSHIHRWVCWFAILSLSILAMGCGSEQTASSDQGVSSAPTQAQNSASEQPADQKVVVYSARKEHLIKPLFDRYEQQTGVKVEYVTDKAGALLTRLKAEGERTPADLLLTVDAGNLWHAAQEGLLQPLDSQVLNDSVPEHLRDDQGRWFGLSLRARTIVYSKERVNPEILSTYSALAAPEFKGRLCLRTAKKVYNQSLVASLIHRLGPEQTASVVEGWVSNLGTDVFSSDTRLIEAIAAGACDIGVVNTYYLGRLQREYPDYSVGLFWANQKDSGVHVNVSGAGVTAHSQRPQAGQELLEWLASSEAQAKFAQLNFEYPVLQATELDPVVEVWGDFKPDTLPVQKLGELQAESIMLMDRAGYN